MHDRSVVSAAPLTIEVAGRDGDELAQLLLRYETVQSNLRHARETFGRRGDEEAEQRVLDLECESSCVAQRIALATSRLFGGKLGLSRGAA